MTYALTATDIDFRDISAGNIEKAAQALVTNTEIVSQPRLSSPEKQPKHIGFGFVIHMDAFRFGQLDQNLLKELGDKGMRIENAKPLFLSTNRPFLKVTFNRGDEESAHKAFEIFSGMTKIIYKNWL